MIRGLGDFKNDKDEKKKTTSYTGGLRVYRSVEWLAILFLKMLWG